MSAVVSLFLFVCCFRLFIAVYNDVNISNNFVILHKKAFRALF